MAEYQLVVLPMEATTNTTRPSWNLLVVPSEEKGFLSWCLDYWWTLMTRTQASDKEGGARFAHRSNLTLLVTLPVMEYLSHSTGSHLSKGH